MKPSASKLSVNKTIHKLDQLIQYHYIILLEDYYIPNIQNIILQEYDFELAGQVTDRRSKTNPIFYREEFQQALMDFEYISEKGGKTILTTPELNNFNWNQGRLRIIENILEGTIGIFIEVDGEQYAAMFGRRPLAQPFDKDVPLKERIYLLKYNGDVRRRWREAYPKEAPVRYPFSNQPPIDIFSTANKYVEENIKKWIAEAIKDAQREITR